MKKVQAILRSRRGEMYIDAAVFILIAGLALALVVSVFGVNWRKTTAQDYADYAARQIASDGAFSSSTIGALTRVAGNGHFAIRVQTSDGYDMTVPISTTETNLPTKEIQQGTAFTVKITSLDANVIGVGGVNTQSVTVYGAANGVSNKYWKG
jgi:uncharacterized membrane protein